MQITLSNYLLLVICVSLWEVGWWKVTRPDFLMDFVRKFFEKSKDVNDKVVYRFPEWIRDMTVSCVTCYSSLHTVIWFAVFVWLGNIFQFVHFNWYLVVAVSLPCAFINTQLVKLHVLIENLIDITNKQKKK